MKPMLIFPVAIGRNGTVSRLHCIFARVLPIDTALDGDSALDPGMKLRTHIGLSERCTLGHLFFYSLIRLGLYLLLWQDGVLYPMAQHHAVQRSVYVLYLSGFCPRCHPAANRLPS